jgi:hypothetical protein
MLISIHIATHFVNRLIFDFWPGLGEWSVLGVFLII